jgi:hypothetical protein
MSSLEKINLERVRYWQGQKLRSRDFNDIHAVEGQRRWWHNRALHNAYGIHEGYATSLTADTTGVVVTAGLAYDDSGRELILPADQTVAIPYSLGKDADLVLFVRYRQEISGLRLNDLAGVGCSGPAVQFVEFVWRGRQTCRSSDGVPIAEIKIDKGQRSQTSLIPPSVAPLARPQLASGSTVPGNTAWTLWTTEFEDEDPYVHGVQTTIDTSAAGFTEAPCYFACLQGPVWSPQTRQILPAIFPSIGEETVGSFVFRLALPQDRTGTVVALALVRKSPQKVTPDEFAVFARRQNLFVNWVGCQKNAALPFLATLLRIPGFTLNRTLLETVLLRLNRL